MAKGTATALAEQLLAERARAVELAEALEPLSAWAADVAVGQIDLTNIHDLVVDAGAALSKAKEAGLLGTE